MNVHKIIVGSVSKLSDKYIINLRLIDIGTGKSEVAVKGDVEFKEELIILAEQLTRKMLVFYYHIY